MSKVEKIKKVVNKIDNILLDLKKRNITNKDEIENIFWDDHPEIMNTYPFLVTQLANGGDRSMLDYMIKTIDKIETGKKNQSDADVEIGQKIVDDFIKPQLDN